MAVKYILKSQNRYKMWKNTEGKLKKKIVFLVLTGLQHNMNLRPAAYS